jgi:hypothetical protein
MIAILRRFGGHSLPPQNSRKSLHAIASQQKKAKGR